MPKISRRKFLSTSATLATAAALSGFGGRIISKGNAPLNGPFFRNPNLARKAIVLGMDGLDPNLVKRFVAEGRMPTFKKLMERGHFGELQTTMPPQSPVAWASFITGSNPGSHGIYDFIHRDPTTFTPFLSTSRSYPSDSKFDIGSWSIPLGSGRVDLLRKGAALWEPFEAHDIPATIYQIPANFPVIGKGKTKAISGMGTPDMLGGYGISTYYTDTTVEGSEKFTSVRVMKVRPNNHRIETKISGPKNVFRNDKSNAEVDFIIRRDPYENVLKLEIQGQTIILKQGEWSDWVQVKFEFIPYFASAPGAVRFLAKEIHPNFKLYMSPIQIDPLEPSMPISNPASYSAEVAEAIGRFYTQGLPADLKALSEGVLSDEEYLQQAKTVLMDSERALDYELSKFNEGLLFFYFSSPDQNEHVMWRNWDPKHPLYDPNANHEVKNAVTFMYERMDECLKRTLAKVDSSTLLIVMSDHGFAPFLREFNLNTWMVEQGFTAVTDRKKYHESKFFDYVDWPKTKAYALGINGIYLNLQGRENKGSLSAKDADGVRAEIIAKLEKVIDPTNGKPVVMKAFDSRDIYRGPYASLAPDILVGYHGGYRISDQSVLGQFPKGIFADRTDKWSADHCMDPRVVPGTLLTNWRCTGSTPGLWDLAPSILNAFGLPIPKEMTGNAMLEKS
ncbi:MAG: alkaline phosphatase family protein [bacterium]|nr:alkaline phosphatase family protein [bacterium]